MLTAPPERVLKLGTSGSGVPSIVYLTGHGNIALTVSGEWLRPSLSGLDDGRDYDTAVAFHPREPLVYVGNEDGRIRVWENAGGRWRPRPELGWHAHRGAVTALAVGSDGALIATSGDDTLKLVTALPEPGIPGRRERLAFPLYHPANWMHIARDKSGRDTALLHSSPWRSVEVWPAR